jgi:hypothetical protein
MKQRNELHGAPGAQDSREQQRNSIARRAYELFVQRGQTHGNDLEDWLRAERELAHELFGAGGRKTDPGRSHS